MKTNFIVSPYTKNWIPGSESIFLTDPYMLHALEKCGEDKNYKEIKIAPSSRATREELIRDHNFVDEKYHKYIPILARRLNYIHGTQHDDFFWRKAFSLSLIRYITLFYDLFQVCESHFSIDEHNCRILSEESYYTPNDFNDHRDFFQSTAYGQEQIFSIYANYFYKGIFKSNKDNFCWPHFGIQQRATLEIFEYLKKFLRLTPEKLMSRVYNFFYRFRSPKLVITESFFSAGHILNLLKKSLGLIQYFPLKRDFQFGLELDYKKRIEISLSEPNFDRFDTFFFASLQHCFPKQFIEEFVSICSWYENYYSNFKKLKYLVNEAWIGDEYSSIATALLREKGIRHIYNEHNFLTHQFLCNNHKYILPLVDEFITLGWFKSGIKNLIVGGSLRNWVAEKRFAHQKHGILYVSAPPAIKTPEFNAAYGDFGAFNARSHLSFTLQFFQSLERSTIQMIVYRDYPLDHHRVSQVSPKMVGYDQEYLLGEFMSLVKKRDKQTSSRTLMAQSRLVIVEYLSTSYLESILSDIPTIVFWNQETYHLTEESAQIYTGLIDVGIVQINPVLAAQFVERIKGAPEVWWSSPRVKLAIHSFLSENIGNPDAITNYLLETVN